MSIRNNDARKAYNEYHRNWRRNNPEKVRKAQERYWHKKASKNKLEEMNNLFDSLPAGKVEAFTTKPPTEKVIDFINAARSVITEIELKKSNGRYKADLLKSRNGIYFPELDPCELQGRTANALYMASVIDEELDHLTDTEKAVYKEVQKELKTAIYSS